MDLSLFPFAQLRSFMMDHGLGNPPSKDAAIQAIHNQIITGRVTYDEVANHTGRATLAHRPIPPAPFSNDAIIVKANDAVQTAKIAMADAVDAKHAAEKARRDVRAALDMATQAQIDSTRRSDSIELDITRLTADLRNEIKTSAPVIDQNLVAREIRQSVASLFESFKQAFDQFPEVAAQIAADYPVTRMVAARDLFDSTSYRDEGNTIDFGGFEVEVWDDPHAPAIVDDYVFNAAALHQTLIALSTEIPHNTWLGGERGTGKTEFVTQVAARLGRKLFRINFDEGLERSEFIGSNTIENGNVVWKAGTLTQAISHAGSIILLDEVGFARAQNISPLHAVTERTIHRALVIAETGERIPVAQKVVFFAADNSIGHGDESGNFAGVREQNSAFLDRFSYTLRFTYLPHADEVDLIHRRTGLPNSAADLLVQFANIARGKAQAGVLTQPPSLRQLFAWAAAVQDGLPVGMAFKNAIINKFPADCEAELVGIYSAVVDAAKLQSYLVRNV